MTKLKVRGLGGLLLSGLFLSLVSSGVLAGTCGSDEGGTACSAGTPGMIRYSEIAHKGDLVFGDEPLGSGAGLSIGLTEEEGVALKGTHFGQWGYELTGYVTTAEAGDGAPPGGMSQVKVHEVGGGHKVYQMNGLCADGAGSRCVYNKDELTGQHLLRVRSDLELPSGDAFRPLGSELAVARVRTILSELGANVGRAYVQTSGDGNYAVYGKIREVSAATATTPATFEAWLSHTVDRMGSVTKINYNTSDDMLRVESIENAYGLKTRFFYMDTEPMSTGALSGFSDATVSDTLKQYWRTHVGEIPTAQVRQLWKGLVVSAVDAYGNRARFDYVDALTGVRLRQMDRLNSLNPGTRSLADAISGLLDDSRYPRLVSVVDAVGVESKVDYTCGRDNRSNLVGTTDEARLMSPMFVSTCFNARESFGAGLAHTRSLFRRVAAVETPFGRTQFHRILRSEGAEHYARWVIEDAVGNV